MNKLPVVLALVLLLLPAGLVSELSRHVLPRLDRVDAFGTPADEEHETRAGDPPDPAGTFASASASALPLTLPHAERVSLGGGERTVVARFEVPLVPPEVLHVVTSAGENARGALLVDVLQRRAALGERRLAMFGSEGARQAGALVAAASSPGARWTPPLADTYIVQVRALPGSVGAFGFALNRRVPLDFPVATESADAVRSFFGDARDGGRRDHHGIDIFAPRGTPVLAAADGIVARVGTSTRGGLHVWQRAEEDTGERLGSLYYAHLDSVSVLAGTRIARGETIGTVGNSGNARTTPPHLHFGLYRRFRGPEDPLPLVGRARAAPLFVEPGHTLGPWLAVAAPTLNLRGGPGTSFDVVGHLAAGSLVEVRGVVGERWVRVRAHVERDDAPGASDATPTEPLQGFVARALLAPARVEPFVLDASTHLLAFPEAATPRLAALRADTTLEARGAFGRYRRVVTADGLGGWIDAAPRLGADGAATLPDG